MINGKKYSWEDISVTLPYGIVIDIQNIEYSDEKELEAVYGKGSNPTGYGVGNYSAEGKVSLLKEESNKLVDYVKKQKKSLYGIPPFTIVVSYANDDQLTKTDVLKACKITKVSNSSGQGDKSVKIEYELAILDGIWRDGLRPN